MMDGRMEGWKDGRREKSKLRIACLLSSLVLTAGSRRPHDGWCCSLGNGRDLTADNMVVSLMLLPVALPPAQTSKALLFAQNRETMRVRQ